MKLLFQTKLQVTWLLLGMFFWEIYEILRKGFTRNTNECWFLQLIVTGKCFDQKIFLKKYLTPLDIQWHVPPGIKCTTEVWRPFTMFIFICTWFVWFIFLCGFFIWENIYVMSIVSDYSCSSFFKSRSFKKVGSPC